MILKVWADTVNAGECRSCHAAIEWAEQTNGKRHPFDGPITAVRTVMIDSRQVWEVDTTVTRSHFSSCAQADDWRRR